ncbi:MAG: hypothetical protein ACLSDJ_01055 [Butyricimonas faecihominis]
MKLAKFRLECGYQGTYRLKPYSETPASYVLPIPQHVIEFNREMKDNDASGN